MAADTNNLLYIYLQRKLLEAANGIHAKRGALSENDRSSKIDELQENGKLNIEIPFATARQHINEHYNIPLKLTTPILYIMRDLELVEITGKFNHMKLKIINIKRGNLIQQTNKLYSICL